MSARQRSAKLALLVLVGFLAALWPAPRRLWADDKRALVRTTQVPGVATQEPPLADRPQAGVAPSGSSAPAPPGTPCPVDPPTPVVRLRTRVPAAVAPGENIEYRFSVENDSD